MYKFVKISLIVGLILIGSTFFLFTMDELIYDYRSNSFLEIIFSILFLFIISFGVIFNSQLLKTYTSRKNLDVIDTPEFFQNKNVLKKSSIKIKLCIINNSLILLLIVGIVLSLYNIVFEVNKNDEEYIFLIIAWFIIIVITIVDIIAIRLDYLEIKNTRKNYEMS